MNSVTSVQPNAGRSGFNYGYIIVICAFISMVAVYLLPFSYGVYFKPMAEELGWSRTVVSGAFSLSRIVGSVVAILFGWLIDKKGARLVLTLCGLVCATGYLVISGINAIWQLYIVYGVLIGAGISIFAPMVSTTAKWFARRRAMMIGIVISGVGVATLIGPPLNTLLILMYGWRLSYIIAGSAIALLIIIVAQFMRREPVQSHESAANQTGDGAGKASMYSDSFSLREATGTRQFWIFFLMSFCYAFSNMGLTIHIVPHITDIGISATTAAYVLATIGGVNVVGLSLMGFIGDRIGNKTTVVIGFILMSLSALLLIFIREVWLFYLFAVIFGFATTGIAPQRGPLIATMFGIKSHGLIFSTSDSSFMLGAALGPLLAGYIFDSTSSYLAAFIVTAVICLLGLGLIISLNLKVDKPQ
jgi:MFS family permease